MNTRLKAYMYLLGATALWGVASPVIKYTLDGIDPFPFLAYRFGISAVIGILLIVLLKIKLPKRPEDYLFLILYGLLATTFALGFLFQGLSHTTVLELGLIAALSPLVVAVGGALLLKEHITKQEKTGIGIAFSGAMLTVFAPVIAGEIGLKFSGNILLILYLLSDAASILLAKKMLKGRYKPELITNFAFVVGALTIIPFTIFTYGFGYLINQIATLPINYHMGVWYMAVISGTLAYYLFIRGERSIEAGEAGLFFYLHPLFSFPLAVFWLGESITPVFILGVIVVSTGVFIAEHRRQKKKK